MKTNLIIEGVDRLGKSTLISGIQNKLGFFNVIHYQKPLRLKCYEELYDDFCLKVYQTESFTNMFKLLKAGRLILDRSHLGEAVYAHRYRGYSGDYVFDLENFVADPEVLENTLVVLLTTSDFSFIVDDGESHDFYKKEVEQEDFKLALHRSKFKHKLTVDVSSGNGTYRLADDILYEVLNNFLS